MTAFKRQETTAAYVLLLPWIVGFVVFLFGPILGALALSLFQWKGIGRPSWVGLHNFVTAFGDSSFYQSLKVTSIFVLTALPIRMVVALGLALLIRRTGRLSGLFSTINYIPAVIPGVALALLYTWILNPSDGLLNRALAVVGIKGPMWLFSQTWALPGLMVMFVWQSGGAMILYLVGLETIPKEIQESAAIDGAGPARVFFRITLPLLTPIILYNLIVGIINNFQYFAPVYVMTKGGPNDATLFYVYNIYRTAFQYFELGYGSSLSVLLFILIAILTLVMFRMSRFWVHYAGE